jgi:hypothetical protein
MSIYENNALLHPWTAFKLALRRRLVRFVQQHDEGWPDLPSKNLPPMLEQFEVGEVLPWKGVKFKVGKVVGPPFPCVILVPTDLSHGHKLKTMRVFRDVTRQRPA